MSSNASNNIVKLNTSRGCAWVTESVYWLAKNPLDWAVFAIAYAILVTPLSLLPGFSTVFPIFLPFFLALLYKASQSQPKIYSLLTELISIHGKNLFLLGAINIGLSAAILIGSLLLCLCLFILLKLLIGSLSLISLMIICSAAFMLAIIKGYFILLSMVLFAPALVVFQNVEPWEALLMSLKAVMKNFMAFFLYSILILIPLMLATLPLIFYALNIELPKVQSPEAVLGWIKSLYQDGGLWLRLLFSSAFSTPFIGISLYIAYKDMFQFDPV